MILDDFRSDLPTYRQMLTEGAKDPFSVLNMVDRRLAAISNHIAVCHRVIAEHRFAAHGSLFGGTREHSAKVTQASDILDQTILIQGEYFDFRYEVLQRVAVLCVPRSNR